MPPPLATQDGKRVVSAGGKTGPILKFVTTQVKVAGFPAGAGGACLLELTVTEDEEVQPDTVLVITSVYVPTESTVGIKVFCPETKCPPTVLQTKEKFGPVEEPVASRLV